MNANHMMRLLIAFALVSMLIVPSAMAANYTIDMYVIRSDTNGSAASITCSNITDGSAGQTDTSGSDGFINLTAVPEGAGIVIRCTGSGYTTNDRKFELLGENNNTYANRSRPGANMSVVLPVISAPATASITRNSATVTFTSSNSYTANRLIYTAPGVENFTTAFSNSTASPSFALTNLQASKTYTVYMESYNILNNSKYRDIDGSTTFTTLRLGTHSYVTPKYPPEPYTPPQSTLTQIISGSNKRGSIIVGGALVVVAVIVYYAFLVRGAVKGGRRRR